VEGGRRRADFVVGRKYRIMVRPPLTPQHYRNTLAKSLNLEMKYPL
jgi:hypothetical protein